MSDLIVNAAQSYVVVSNVDYRCMERITECRCYLACMLDFKSQIMGTNYAEIFVFVFYVNNFHTYKAILVILHMLPYIYILFAFVFIHKSELAAYCLTAILYFRVLNLLA